MKPKITNALLDELLKDHSQPGDLLTGLKKRLISRILNQPVKEK